MTFGTALLSFFELAAVVLLIVGFINEKKVIAFEAKLFRAIRIHIRNRKVRKHNEMVLERRRAQSRAAVSSAASQPVVCMASVGKKNGKHQVA